MKLAFNGIPLMSPLTGIGHYTYQLAKNLKSRHEIDLNMFYGTGWYGEDVREMPVSGIKAIKTLADYLVPNPRIVGRYVKQYQFSRGVKKYSFDLYHEPNFLAYEFNGPTIVTVHDLSWIRFPETHPKDRIKMMDRFFERSLKYANRLITDSEFVKSELIEVFGIDPEKIHGIPLGVESQFQPKSQQESYESLRKYDLQFKKYIIALGTLEPRKNLVLALEAFMTLPQTLRGRYPLVLVGMIGWHTGKLEKLIAPLITSGEIRQLGYISRLDLINVISGAKSLIYPSIYEGFGLPPLEAMACGVPVIASNVSSIPEVVADSGILIDSNDVNQLRESMLNVIEDHELCQVLSKRGLERSQLFTWDNCVQQTVDVYRKVLAEA